jgi:hypothetical protein
MVAVHPSHKGSTYQRKPKKKKKKKKAESEVLQDDVERYYLAPVNPNSPEFKNRFIEDDEVRMNMGGKGATPGYQTAGYGGAEASNEGMDDMEQAPIDEGSSSGGRFGEAGDGKFVASGEGKSGAAREGTFEETSEQQAIPKKRKKKQSSSTATLDSRPSFSVMKKDKKNIELLDYDKLAQIDN